MNELIKIPFGDFTRIGLTLPEQTDIATWKQIGHSLFMCRESLMFAIGDWVNYGQSNYGDKYAEARKVFGEESAAYGGYDEATIRRAASVSARVPVVLRSTTLSFGHHSVVATLAEKDQKYWLQKAETERLSVRALTELIRGKLKDGATKGTNSTADVFIFDRWINDAVRGFSSYPIDKWKDDELLTRIRRIEEIEKPLLAEAKERGLEVV